MPYKYCIDCKFYDDIFGCLCSSYDKQLNCPMEIDYKERNKFEDEYARWVLEEMRFEEE